LSLKAYAMDDAANRLQTVLRGRDGLFTARPTIYIVILLTALVAPVLYNLRTDGIFACPGTGYTSDRYLSVCNTKNYGDYDHGAFWFDLEPAAEMSAARADVLFLGNSQLQFAFSTVATAQWFSSASASYYLLGFIGYGNSIFTGGLLHKLKPRAEVYVINVLDYGFFQRSETPYAIAVHDDAARTRYEVKRLWQFVHKPICSKLAALCGHQVSVFRSRQTGAFYPSTYISRLSRMKVLPVSYDQQIDQREIDEAVEIGRKFLSELPVKGECVILTAVPSADTKLGVANAIANGVGEMLVVPGHLDDLQTFDDAHLDQASAERWSKAFFETAGPQIQKCLGVTHHGGNAAASFS
jgi:hypothetical protein